MPTFDSYGQPHQYFNAGRRADRDLSEMLGLVKGVLADGVVTDDEAFFLRDWMEAHPDVVSAWPGSVLCRRLRMIFEDGVVTDAERDDLSELLQGLIGGKLGILSGLEPSATLPFDDPQPLIEVPDRVFCLTGRFAFGPRAICEDAVRRVGGWCESSISMETNFLVIGTFGSRDWVQSNWGRKVEKAVEYREKYGWPRIVSEDRWAAAI
jgi:hypothetical protein